MHALLIHQAFTAPNQAGGTRHFEFARHAVRNGHRFTIVTSDLSYLTGQQVGAGQGPVAEENVEGVRILRARTYPSLHQSFVWRVVCFLSFMVSSIRAALRAGPVDVVVGTTPPIFQAVSAWAVSVLRWRPFLLEVRDLWPKFAIGLGVLKNPLLIVLSRWLESFLYARATHLLVNSPAYRDYLVARGVPGEKVTLIPNGVDPTMFDPEARGESVRRELDLGTDFVVTYAGALGLANDIGTVLEAADRLRDETGVKFLLVGDGKERGNLEAMAKSKGLPNVIFAGARAKHEMPAILAASDACVATLKDIPEFRTTYPNKVFDYMAAGRPTILAIDGVIRSVMERAGGGIYVPPGNPEALADVLIKLKGNPDRARRMGNAAREYVARHFDRNLHAKAFVDLLIGLGMKKRRLPDYS